MTPVEPTARPFRWRWYLVPAILIGLVVGIGGYTFVYAKGASYMTNDPAACANCHVMNEQYDGWITSSHRAVAVCNDCHTPDGHRRQVRSPRPTTASGTRSAFTTGLVSRAHPGHAAQQGVTEASCQKCHADDDRRDHDTTHPKGEPLTCVRCHDSVGHLRVAGAALCPASTCKEIDVTTEGTPGPAHPGRRPGSCWRSPPSWPPRSRPWA